MRILPARWMRPSAPVIPVGGRQELTAGIVSRVSSAAALRRRARGRGRRACSSGGGFRAYEEGLVDIGDGGRLSGTNNGINHDGRSANGKATTAFSAVVRSPAWSPPVDMVQ